MQRKSLVLTSVVFTAAIALSGAAHAMTFRTLYSFCAQQHCTDGEGPIGGVILDSSGNLYGTTNGGGDGDKGTIFRLARDPKTGNYTYNRLYSLCSQFLCSDGAYPIGDLIMDVAGNLYGTTTLTTKACGTVFELTAGGTYNVLHTFACSDGSIPIGLTYVGVDAPYNGISALFGMTQFGGAHDSGVVYQLTPRRGTWTTTVLHDFCSEARCADGKEPWARLLADSSGLLYGTTTYGGVNGAGTVFELSRIGHSWSEAVLHDFCSEPDCQDGEWPFGGVIEDTAGALFGATFGGGDKNSGAAYKLASDGSSYQVIHSFCAAHGCADGAAPVGELRRKGTSYFGVTFKIPPTTEGNVYQLKLNKTGTWIATPLHNFHLDCSDGCEPYPMQLAMDADGNLFGTTLAGGQFGWGTVFELSP